MAAVENKRVINVDGKNILREQDGRLVCSCMGWVQGSFYQPCSHVWAAMKGHLDANPEHPLMGLLLVPIFKDPVQGAHVLAEVYLDHAKARHGMTPFALSSHMDEQVAWLGASEGRWEMRRVLLEYIRSRYPDAPACKTPTHGHYLLSPKERKKLDLDDTSPTVLAGVLSVLQTDACWRCHHGDDASDLIPDI